MESGSSKEAAVFLWYRGWNICPEIGWLEVLVLWCSQDTGKRMLNVFQWLTLGSVWHYGHPLKRAQHNQQCLTGRFLLESVHRGPSWDFCTSGDQRWHNLCLCWVLRRLYYLAERCQLWNVRVRFSYGGETFCLLVYPWGFRKIEMGNIRPTEPLSNSECAGFQMIPTIHLVICPCSKYLAKTQVVSHFWVISPDQQNPVHLHWDQNLLFDSHIKQRLLLSLKCKYYTKNPKLDMTYCTRGTDCRLCHLCHFDVKTCSSVWSSRWTRYSPLSFIMTFIQQFINA